MNQEQYIVTKDTCALLPAKQLDVSTTVIEDQTTKHFIQTPMQIIEASCIHYWSNYEGRRKSVVDKLQYKQKTPIPVSVLHKLCFFPTHSPTHIDNCWINWLQIDSWKEIKQKNPTNNDQVEVFFKNGYRLVLDISRHTMFQQNERAFAVMYKSGMIEAR